MIVPRAEITPASTPRHRFFSSGAPGSNVSARFPDRREWRAQFARLILQDAKLRWGVRLPVMADSVEKVFFG